MKCGTVFAVSAGILTLSTAAQAETLLFSYSDPSESLTFEQSSTPTPVSYTTGNSTVVQITNSLYSSITWYTTGSGGLFQTPDSAFNIYGPQVYSGSEANPVFAPGVFQGVNGLNQQAGTLTITAAAGGVPEPATWGMMLVGLGVVGALARSRSRAALAGV